MAKKLPRYSLAHDKKKGDWILQEEKSSEIRRRFETKADATAGGVLEQALGPTGGSVRIRKLDGTIQEERTFPGAADPPESEG